MFKKVKIHESTFQFISLIELTESTRLRLLLVSNLERINYEQLINKLTTQLIKVYLSIKF